METPFEAHVSAALAALESDPHLSLRAAARAYGVALTTLARRRDQGINRRTGQAARQLLSPEQEDLLVKWILTLERDGHALTHVAI
jgi:helix-turn-helix, Psq domain